MFEIDFLPVGDGERSGDAIALRFSQPGAGRPVVAIIDAGFQDDGEAIVNHVTTYYDTDVVDVVISTHADGDHVGGLPTVINELRIETLCVHRPAQHGYPNDSGAERAEELVTLAEARNVRVIEPFSGVHGFGQALLVAGPTPEWYVQMLGEQQSREAAAAPPVTKRLTEAAKHAARRALDAFPSETFFDDAGGDGPRNNGSVVVDLQVNGNRMLLTSDVGVPGLTNALDYLDVTGRNGRPVDLFQLPHHGSRHNLDRDTVGRVLGDHTDQKRGIAVASVSRESANPAPRGANAAGRRGYPVYNTHSGLRYYGDGAPGRQHWRPATPLPPLAEAD